MGLKETRQANLKQSPKSPDVTSDVLSGLGISKMQPHRWQQAAARDHYDKEAKKRQKRKPADSVVENLPQQNQKARDAVGKTVGVAHTLTTLPPSRQNLPHFPPVFGSYID